LENSVDFGHRFETGWAHAMVIYEYCVLDVGCCS
jgi:hypothetical protein